MLRRVVVNLSISGNLVAKNAGPGPFPARKETERANAGTIGRRLRWITWFASASPRRSRESAGPVSSDTHVI